MMYQSIFLIAAFLLVIHTDFSSARRHCQQYDIINHRGSVNTWKKAREYCQNRGMDLVKIDNEGEDAFLRSILRDYPGGRNHEGWYIGGKHVNGRWRWADGTRMTYSNFALSSSYSEVTSYAVIFLNDLDTWKYLSPWSSNKMGIICESTRC